MHLHYDDERLRQVLTAVRVIAMVGASPSPHRPSHRVMAFLQQRGYRVIPVNPRCSGEILLREPVYGSLSEIPAQCQLDMVDIFRRSEEVPAIVEEAIDRRAQVVWMQLGVIHGQAAKRAMDYGLEVIMDRCPKIELERLGLDTFGDERALD